MLNDTEIMLYFTTIQLFIKKKKSTGTLKFQIFFNVFCDVKLSSLIILQKLKWDGTEKNYDKRNKISELFFINIINEDTNE